MLLRPGEAESPGRPRTAPQRARSVLAPRPKGLSDVASPLHRPRSHPRRRGGLDPRHHCGRWRTGRSLDGNATLTSSLDQSSIVVNDVKPKGDSAGDLTTLAATLKRDGQLAGRAEYAIAGVDPRYAGAHFSATLLLSNGTIELADAGLAKRAPGLPKPGKDTILSIAGGTGAYVGARGTYTAADLTDTTERIELAFAG